MEEAKSLDHQQQQQRMLQQQQQLQQHQQQLLLLQQIQQQKHQQQQASISRFPSNIAAHLRAASVVHRQQSQSQSQQQQQQLQQHQQQLLLLQQIQQQKHQQQEAAISRFPSNIAAHLRASSVLHRQQSQSQSQQQQQQHQQIANNPNPTSNHPNQQPNPSSNPQQMQPKVSRGPPATNQAELQMAYQDLWRVCHPEHKRPFSSLEDACERLLPYHVVADYEAEEDDRILDSDTAGQMLSRSQQWDHNIAAKVAEFAATFEKQVFAFNIISHKRALGEFRSEERLMIEQILLQEERQALRDLSVEMDSRQKAGREAHEANLRMAAMVHAEQAHAEMMARAPIRPNALGSQGSDIPVGHDITDQEQLVNPEEMINGWRNNVQRDEKEPSDDFLNDEETENGDAGMGEFDLNTR